MSKDIQPQYSRQSSFEVFRYQLVVDKTLQKGLFDKYESAEDIRADKNNILQEILTHNNFRFRSGNSEINSKLMFSQGTMSYFKIGVKRKTKVFKKDFSEDVIENYPNVILAFNNHPDIQKVAVQNNTHAFANCKTVSHIIQKSIDEKVKDRNLTFSGLADEAVTEKYRELAENLQIELMDLIEELEKAKKGIRLGGKESRKS